MTGAELAMTDSLTNNAWQVEAHLEYLDRPGGDRANLSSLGPNEEGKHQSIPAHRRSRSPVAGQSDTYPK